MTSGPFHTDREALAASLYHRHGRPPNTDVPTTALNLADLNAALSDLELGDWDRKIVEWLAGWEPATVAAICGLITRARDAGLPLADVSTIRAALDEAAGYKRDGAANCAYCTDRSCGTCQDRLQAAQAYDDLAARLQRAREAAPTGQPTQPGGYSLSCRGTAGTATPESEAGR
jgi:hypothetical protein